MSLRDISLRKLINTHFVGVLIFMSFNYYAFVFEFMLRLRPSYLAAALIVFHIFFFMVVWSMIHAIISDPGRVPIYWGFFAEESDNRKRRYCLLCHSFKPER
jgi:glucan phosphoethanolaminetransferase (alkaline phosphatase superfamily)